MDSGAENARDPDQQPENGVALLAKRAFRGLYPYLLRELYVAIDNDRDA